jgi:hypothetical protein
LVSGGEGLDLVTGEKAVVGKDGGCPRERGRGGRWVVAVGGVGWPAGGAVASGSRGVEELDLDLDWVSGQRRWS